jgi:hypothetical protein
VSGWLLLGTATAFLAGLGVVLMGGSVSRFLAGFPVVFLLALGAQFLAGNALVNAWGIEFVIFALLLGLLVSNTIGTPNWLIPAVRTEFYIKTGLVLMGATIIFGEILRAGALGVLQSVLVVIVVWYFSFWLAKKLRLDDEFATMLSTAVSICGVSAAIAACGAIEGDRRKLSYVTFHRADSGRADDRDSALAHQTVWHSGNGRWRVARRNAGYNGLGGCGRRVDWRNGHENRNHC